MSGIDVNTLLCLHFDGDDDTTVFTDSSSYARGVTPAGSAHIHQGEKKFGSASGAFDGTDDYLVVDASTDFDFGTGDFTIDWWEFRTENSPGGQNPACSRDNGNPYTGLLLAYDTSEGHVFCYASSAKIAWDIFVNELLGTITLSVWIHRAVVRNGTTFYFFENGVVTDTATSALGIAAGSSGFEIGRGQVASQTFQGYIDEFRVSNIARWTADFSASLPTEAYSADVVATTNYLVYPRGRARFPGPIAGI